MATLRAFTTGVAGIDLDKRYSRKDGFVPQEASQLCECPRVKNRSLFAPSPNPRSYTRQFFDGDTAIRAFGFLNDLFRNAMVDVCSKASFFAREFLQVTFCRLTLRRLKVGTKFAVAIANIIHGRATVSLTIGVCGNLDNTKINTEKIIYIAWRRLCNIAGSSQKPFPTMVDQVRLSLLMFEKFLLLWPSRVRNCFSTSERPYAYPVFSETKDSGIVTDGSMLRETTLNFLVQFVGVGNLRKQPNNYLRRQRKSKTHFMVEYLMEREWRKNLLLPCLMTDPVGTLIRRLKSLQQNFLLLCTGVQSDFGYKFHLFELYHTPRKDNAILPQPEGWGILA
jgi:hypothetical protein